MPTPHPLSLLLGVVAGAGSSSAARTVWVVDVEIALVVLLAGVCVLASRIGGAYAGCVAVMAVVALPELGAAVSSGTVDVFFAAAIIWAMILARGRPGWALLLATVAALARPEGIALVVLLAAFKWRNIGTAFRCEAVAAIILVPTAWLVMGAALFADPLAALHVTITNADTIHARHGVAGVGHVLIADRGWVGVLLAAAAVAVAWLLRKNSPDIAFAVCACIAMGIVVTGVSARAAVPARYFVGELACAVSITIGSIPALAKGRAPRWAVAAGLCGLAVVSVAAALAPRSVRVREGATQGHELKSLARVLASDHSCAAISLAPHVFVPVVVLEAHRPVQLSPAEVPGHGICRLTPRDPVTATGDGWGPEPGTLRLERVPPNSDIIDGDDDWVLYAS